VPKAKAFLKATTKYHIFLDRSGWY